MRKGQYYVPYAYGPTYAYRAEQHYYNKIILRPIDTVVISCLHSKLISVVTQVWTGLCIYQWYNAQSTHMQEWYNCDCSYIAHADSYMSRTPGI